MQIQAQEGNEAVAAGRGHLVRDRKMKKDESTLFLLRVRCVSLLD